MTFSKEVLEKAFTATNGELAWKQPAVFAALDELAAARRAVYGGEAWVVREGKIFLGIKGDDGIEGFYAWSCKQAQGEAWDAYVARAKDEAVAAINKMETTNFVKPEILDNVYFNLRFENESGEE